jgi:hypothetical protein
LKYASKASRITRIVFTKPTGIFPTKIDFACSRASRLASNPLCPTEGIAELVPIGGGKLLLMREVGEGAMELSLLPSGVPVTVMLVTGSIPGGNNCGGGTEGTDEGHPDGIAEDDCWVPLLLCGEVG